MAKRRKDLERVETSYPEHYIGSILIPIITVMNRAGKLFYKLIENGGTAVKGRTKGTSLSSRTVVDADIDFSLELTEDRVKVPYEYSEEHGRPFADKAGAMSVKKTLQESYEVDAATLHLGGTGHIDVGVTHSGSLLDAVAAEVDSLDTVAGELVFVTNKKTFNAIMKMTEIVDKLKFTGVIAQDAKVVRGLKPSVLAEILGVDRVLVGSNNTWNVGDAHNGKACLVKIAPKGLGKQDLLLSPYGNVRLELPNGAGETAFTISSWDDDDVKGHMYDGKGYNSIETLNTSIVKFNNI